MPIYMQFPNAPGAVSASGFEKWIELKTLEFTITRPADSRVGTHGFAATGKLDVHPIKITKFTDGSSPQLTIAALQGVFDKTVKIAFVTTSQAGMTNFMSYELSKAGISFAETHGDEAGLPTETFQITFGKIVYTFNNMDQAGRSAPTITGYDLEEAKSL